MDLYWTIFESFVLHRLGWTLHDLKEKQEKFMIKMEMLIYGLRNFTYSESRIYEDIARVFYYVVFSIYLGSNAAEKRV